MNRKSRQGKLSEESRRWWDCGGKLFAEWTCEGGTKGAVSYNPYCIVGNGYAVSIKAK